MTPTVLVTLAVLHSAPVLIGVPPLVGEWRGESQFGASTLVFTPNGACVEKSVGRLRAATYRVDPRKRPAEIDFWDPRANGPRRGIYKVSGDSLIVSWAEYVGDARPVGFEASSLRTEVLHLTRVARTSSPKWEKELMQLAPWGNKLFIGSAGAPPPVVIKHAGVVPKGETKTVRLKVTNIYAVPLKLGPPSSKEVSRVAARWPDQLDPKQSGFVEVQIDTRGLDGECAVRVPVKVWSVDPKTGRPAGDPKTEGPFMSWPDVVILFVSR